MLEQWKGTGNMGIRRPQVKSTVLLPSWGSGIQGSHWSHSRRASAEIQQRKARRWLSKQRKEKETEPEVKTLPRWKERHRKGLVQKPCPSRSCTSSPNGISNIPTVWRLILKGSPSIQFVLSPASTFSAKERNNGGERNRFQRKLAPLSTQRLDRREEQFKK